MTSSVPAGTAATPAPRMLISALSLVVLIVAILQTAIIPELAQRDSSWRQWAAD